MNRVHEAESEDPAQLAALLQWIARLTHPASPGAGTPPRGIDVAAWNALLHWSDRQGLRPLIAHRVAAAAALDTTDAGGIPPATMAEQASAWTRFRSRYRAQSMLVAQVDEALTTRGIPWLLFKGLVVAESLYEAPWERFARDVDILVPRRALLDALTALSAAGYDAYRREFYESRHFHIPLVHRAAPASTRIELHWDLAPRSSPVRFDVEGWFARRHRATLGIGDVPAACSSDAIGYLAWHAFTSGVPTARDLSEVCRSWHRQDAAGRAGARESAGRAGAGRFLEAALGLGAEVWDWTPGQADREQPASRLRDRFQHRFMTAESVLGGADPAPWPLDALAYWSLAETGSRSTRALFYEIAERDRWLEDRSIAQKVARRAAGVFRLVDALLRTPPANDRFVAAWRHS